MTDLKRIYQSDLPSRAIAVYLYLRGRANPGGRVLAGHPHHGQGAEDVGEHRAPGCAGSGKGRIPLCGGKVSVE